MKSVVYIITSLKRTGPVNILFDIIKYLDRNVYSPYVITLCPEEENSRQEEFLNLNVTIISLNIPRGARFLRQVRKIKKNVEDIDPSVIHCFGFRADIIGSRFFPRYKKISSQLNYAFDDYVMTYGKAVGHVMAKLTIWSLPKFDYVVACAKDVALKLADKGVHSKVIWNSIDTSLFCVPTYQEKEECRKRLGLPADVGDVFIFVGVLTERKLPLIAVNAFKRYLEIYPKAALIVLGRGNEEEECKRISQGTRIFYFGNVSDTRSYLKASDYYVATSKAEGMPVSVLEGLALELPVVLSDIRPHREILSFNKNAGLLAEVNSIESTFFSMLAITKKDKAGLKKSARDIIDRKLNSKTMSSEFQKYYEVLSNQSRVK